MTVGVYALTDAGVMALLHRARSFDLAATRAALRAAIERERLPAAPARHRPV